MNELREDQRYLFIYNSNKYFRANYHKSISNYLFVNKYYFKTYDKNINLYHKNCIWSIPKNDIKFVLSLNDITYNKLKLPTEVLNIIDNFIL